jgi:hypothetical protein
VDLCNNGFTPGQLNAKIITSQMDISNNLDYINKIYSNYHNTDLSNVLQINTAIIPYNSTELIETNKTYQYNYSTLQYLDSNYIALFTGKSSLVVEDFTIDLAGHSFSFFDISNNRTVNYTSLKIYTTGWDLKPINNQNYCFENGIKTYENIKNIYIN